MRESKLRTSIWNNKKIMWVSKLQISIRNLFNHNYQFKFAGQKEQNESAQISVKNKNIYI